MNLISVNIDRREPNSSVYPGHSQRRASSEIYREAREDRQDSLVFFAPLAIFAVPTLCFTLI
jgi:hypothetical protein